MRVELIGYLQALSDPDYQRIAWIEQRLPIGSIKYDEFDYAIHFLYDDTNLGENPEADIGDILNKGSSSSHNNLTRKVREAP
jgi:hypothetical protein